MNTKNLNTVIVKKSFGGSEIEFEPFVSNGNVMVNATEMAKIFGKLPKDFLRNDDVQSFINECLKKENSPFLGIQTLDDLVVSRQKSGTWMHRVLALKFAAWLNPAFELWVYQTIEEIMFGHSRENDESIRRTIVMQFEVSQIEKKKERSGEDFDRYMFLKDQLTIERTVRSQQTKQRFRDLYKFLAPSLKNN